jgi:hypothetical protein
MGRNSGRWTWSIQIWKPASQVDIEVDEKYLKKPMPIVDVIDDQNLQKGVLPNVRRSSSNIVAISIVGPGLAGETAC